MTATHAIYHLSVRNISRAGGSSACASLAYITGLKIRDEYLAKTHDYSRKERVQAVQTFLPSGTPPAFDDPAYLVNSLETTVTSSTARNAKMIVVALPQGMSLEEQKATVGRFVRENLTDRGFPAVVAWHTDKDGRNPHAHIEVMNRKLNHGKWSKMTKTTYVLDKDGQRVPLIDKKTGRQKVDKRNRKQWKRQTVTANPLNSQETLLAWRKSWETTLNAHLPQQMKVSCQSLEAQGIDRVPTIHEGYAAREIEKRGGTSDRATINRGIRERNSLIDQLRRLIDQLNRLSDEVLTWFENAQKRAQARLYDAFGFLTGGGRENPQETPQNDFRSQIQQEAQKAKEESRDQSRNRRNHRNRSL